MKILASSLAVLVGVAIGFGAVFGLGGLVILVLSALDSLAGG